MEREGDLLAAKSYLSTILITVILFWLNVSTSLMDGVLGSW